jgi:hypothetical protein
MDAELWLIAILNINENTNLIAAEWVMTFSTYCWSIKFATVSGRAVVIKDDFSVEVFKSGHVRSLVYSEDI